MKRDFRSANTLYPANTPKATQASLSQSTNNVPNLAVGEIKHRVGTVLDSTTLIKVDDYLFKQNGSVPKIQWFPRRVSGAAELRVVEGTSILGVAQPSLPGVRGILDALNAGRNTAPDADGSALAFRKKVLWINLREEPLLYLNGRPVVLREIGEPFRNMETFKGINESRLRDLEWRFKEDVVAEAQRCGGSVLLHEEENENQLTEKWESAPPSVVMTPEDVFFQLRQEGYRVRYERIPCTSGQPPSPGFFDELLRCLATTDRDTWVVFNCQSGNARSTVAIIATYAVQARRGFWSLIQEDSSSGLEEISSPDKKRPGNSKGGGGIRDSMNDDLASVYTTTPPPMMISGLNGQLPPQAISPSIPDAEKDETTRQLMAGWYLPVLQMLRLLIGGGREAKSRMDIIIDRCAHTSNLRTEVLRFRAKAANSREKFNRSLHASRAAVALQRYMLMILWETYLAERSVREGFSRQTTSSGFPSNNKGSSAVFEELGAGGSTTDLESLARALPKPPMRHVRSISREGFPISFLEPTSFSPDYRPTFSEWLESRREILSLFKSVRSDPEHALEGPDVKEVLGADEMSESRTVMQARRGVMLNTDTILKLDDFEQREGMDMTEAFKGGRNFRRVPGMRVYGVATPTIHNAKTLIRILQTSHGAEKLLFCNLREEPFVYINEKPFVLRSVHKPFRNLDVFAEMDVQRLEKAEDRMKKEILQEAARYDGKILVHVEGADGSLKVVWEDIEDDEAVQTPKEVFANFSQSEILPVGYNRVPMTPDSEPGLSDIDDILATIRASKSETGTHFVFFCQRGRGRSTIATILACMELDEFVPTDDSESLSVMRGTNLTGESQPSAPSGVMELYPDRDALLSPMPLTESLTGGRTTESSLKMPQQESQESDLASAHTDFPSMLSLMRVLRHGTLAKRWLDATIDKCGAIFNLRKNILTQSMEATSARSEEQSEALIQSALVDLRKYFILLEVAGYCMEKKSHPSTTVSFKNWCSARPELLTLKDNIMDKAALHVMSPTDEGVPAPSPMLGSLDEVNLGQPQMTVSDRVLVANRKGRVLVRGSILKTDHFPGCKRLPDPKVEIEGAPNFRAVWPEGKLDDIDLRVYGTGIPTDSALHDILHFLHSSGDQQPVVWINLREEPILYLNGRPFVLRRLDEPFANLEHTGISRHRVEEMEIRFKEDVLDEAASNQDYSVLIHEEDETGGLKPKWEKVESVLTSRELFDSQRLKFPMQYWRIPITDEQSPKPSAFDAIVDIVAASKSTSHLVFNCQMGRGRTTSGLIVACATRLRMIGALRRFASVVDEKVAPSRKFRSKIRAKLSDIPDGIAKELRGEFLAIMAQIRLMDDGLEAKRAMDALIDVCDAMQNLREAIHEVKMRSTKVDLSPAVRAEALGVAEHYLKRYAHLIQFAAYLLSSPDLSAKRVKFATWLKSRPELGNALKSLIGYEKKSLLSS